MTRTAILGLIGLALASPALAKPNPAMPPQVRGIWMDDNAQGRRQCQSYLAAMRKDGGDASGPLVGAEVITARSLHSYAEYGEGNFYEPRRIAALGKQKWRVDAALGLDGMPEDGEAGRATFTLSIEGGKLLVRMESINAKPASGSAVQRYFRCAAVPPGMYAG
ncbi:MAG: hypothetical protein J0M19_02800 [Sphingomonadales bacterium]|nr:hypothetical protein [Sphingomonadales bacterium]